MILSFDALAVVGPTASGKTASAIALAKRINGEIISCDSMQIYKEMDIGTAKATEEEIAAIPHHLLDFLPPNTPFSAADYAEKAKTAAEDIKNRGKIPIFCGGTGLYLEAVRTGRHDSQPVGKNDAYRDKLLKIAETEEGKDELFRRLCEIDSLQAASTHKNNVRRVIRALEIYHETGIPKSEWDRRSREVPPDMNIAVFLLDFHDRSLLYRRIEERVDVMLEKGLVEETRRLYSSGYLNPGTTASQAIGYKELIPYITGEMSLSDAVTELKTATRRYAKRQLTWFHAVPDIHTVYLDDGLASGELKSADAVCEEIYGAVATK